MARKITILNKRDLILDSAGKLFRHYGYEKTTIDEIAKDAGIGKGTIYTEFKNKDEIMLCVMRGLIADLNSQMIKSVGSFSNYNLDTIRQMIIKKLLICYSHSKNNFHGTEVFKFVHNNKIMSKEEFYYDSDKIMAELLLKVANNGYIRHQDDYFLTAISIRKALSYFYPPLCLEIKNKNELINQANLVIDLLLFGLTQNKV